MKELIKKHQEIIKYIIVGGCTTLVSLGTKYLLLFTILDASDSLQLQLAIIISWIAAVTFAYIANKIIVFESKNPEILKEIFAFFFSRITTLLIEMLLMWFTITFLEMNSRNWVIFWTLSDQIIILVLNYIFSKFIVFKKNK